jgi:large subunit ribosomal protein L30
MAKLKITQVKSKNGTTKRQQDNLRSLGIRKIHQTVEVKKNPVTEGQLAKIRHLVEVEEVK